MHTSSPRSNSVQIQPHKLDLARLLVKVFAMHNNNNNSNNTNNNNNNNSNQAFQLVLARYLLGVSKP